MPEDTLLFDQIEPLPRGRTGLAVLGFPISHSLSPILHNAALREISKFKAEFKQWEYQKIELAPERLPEALDRLRDCGYRGLNLTIPHKVEVLPFLGSIDPDAELMGAVNTLTLVDGGWSGCNTDGYGLEQGLRETLKVELQDSQVLVLGAGGAARAAATQCLRRGCSRLWIGNRSIDRLKKVEEILKSNFGEERISPFSLDDLPAELSACRDLIVVNATSLGLRDTDPMPINAEFLCRSAKVFDMIYNPKRTSLLEKAEKLGMAHANGLSMLVGQAAKALEIWTGVEVKTSYMYEALPTAMPL